MTTKTIKVTATFKKPKSKSYNKKDLKQGMLVEKEHTTSKRVQKIIAQNHLDEDKKYYKKLKKVEKK
jgi:hypothetical protein